MRTTPAAAPSPLRVLAVDDSPDIRRLLQSYLGDSGYDVRVAASADEALRVCAEMAVHVAVCDIRMPGHDGVWLVDQLRRQSAETVVILATAVDDLAPAVTLRQGVAAYLVKPLTRAAVLGAVSQAMGLVGVLSPDTRPITDSELSALDAFTLDGGKPQPGSA